jgi:hypothetical protein
MKKTLLLLALLPLGILASCSDDIPDPAVRHGFDALSGAYASDVKPADAAYSNCTYVFLVSDSRHVARCGLSYGGPDLARVGYWEIVSQGDAFIVYAMNGKALAALDRITRPGSLSNAAFPGVFKSGAGRVPLDIAKVSASIK